MTAFNRPKIKPPLKSIDYLLEIVAITGVVFIWVQCLYYYNNLPETIPLHFDITGKVDGYGTKNLLFISPVIASILYLGLGFLNRFPWVFNYPVIINENNALIQYGIANRTFRIIIFAMVLLQNCIVSDTYQATKNSNFLFGPWVMLIMVVGVLLPVVFMIFKSLKNK